MNYKTLSFNHPSVQGEMTVPGDKSVSHRSIMFGSIAKGKTTVTNFLNGEDCLSTIACFQKLGVTIEIQNTEVTITSPGIDGWTEPDEILYTGNSGTTTRLMLGILSAAKGHFVMMGDESIAKRPMRRVVDPLRQMGATIDGRVNGQYTPLSIRGSKLTSIHYDMPVASAQVKSAILFGGLFAEGTTTINEVEKTRDHTERMLQQFGVQIEVNDKQISFTGQQKLKPTHIEVPGDISSAAFFLVAAAITPNSHLKINRVGLNPTRDGIVDVLKKMNAHISTEVNESNQSEPIGTIDIHYSTLQATEISGDLIPRLIDEIPIIALLATQANGKTIIRNAEELKVKETNRIDTVVHELLKLGANIQATEDGMVITGPTRLSGGTVSSHGDHRIGMMLAVASLISSDPIQIQDADCISVSYPYFFEDLQRVTRSRNQTT